VPAFDNLDQSNPSTQSALADAGANTHGETPAALANAYQYPLEAVQEIVEEQGRALWERIKITATDCAWLSPRFLAEERLEIGERWFNQEYMCQWVDTVDSVFSYEDIHSALDDRRGSKADTKNWNFFALFFIFLII
jgi:hypothetical protein